MRSNIPKAWLRWQKEPWKRRNFQKRTNDLEPIFSLPDGAHWYCLTFLASGIRWGGIWFLNKNFLKVPYKVKCFLTARSYFLFPLSFSCPSSHFQVFPFPLVLPLVSPPPILFYSPPLILEFLSLSLMGYSWVVWFLTTYLNFSS